MCWGTARELKHVSTAVADSDHPNHAIVLDSIITAKLLLNNTGKAGVLHPKALHIRNHRPGCAEESHIHGLRGHGESWHAIQQAGGRAFGAGGQIVGAGVGRKGGLVYAGLIALAARATRLLPRREHLRKGRRQSCKVRRTISPQAQSPRTLGCKHGPYSHTG